MRALATTLFILGYACAVGCGTIGEPLYPAVNIPTRVSDLAAIERGDRIEITFTIPPLTTEGLAFKAVGAIELRVGPDTSATFQIDQWAPTAHLVDVPPSKPGAVRTQVSAQDFIGKTVVAAVRLSNTKGRFSDWSNTVALLIEP